jgi:hypothetical protein
LQVLREGVGASFPAGPARFNLIETLNDNRTPLADAIAFHVDFPFTENRIAFFDERVNLIVRPVLV